MTRRLPALVASCLAIVSLSGCATFDRNGVAAEVNGVELSVDDVEATVSNEVFAQQLGDTPGDVSRSITGLFVVSVATRDLVTQDQLVTASAQITENSVPGWDDVPAAVRAALVHVVALNASNLSDDEVRTRLEAADIHIDPRYGRWDAATQQLQQMLP